MTRRTPGLHDPDVTTAEWGERVDTDYDYYPTRAEAEADAELDRRYPTQATPGPLTDALDAALRVRRFNQCRDAADDARYVGDDERARYWDMLAERWAE